MGFATTILLDGLIFPEAPRWHNGKLWFSDVLAQQVMAVDLSGHAETVVPVPGMPSGLGWLPDGRLLVVSMLNKTLLRLDPGGLIDVADLGTMASSNCNDMVVDQHGRAYIGNFGFDLYANQPYAQAEIILVTPEGAARVVADKLDFPNGTVITPDRRTLIVAETAGHCLTAFDIDPHGSLTRRRLWARLEGSYPDGICLDVEGAIWVACQGYGEVLRVFEGGEVAQRIKVATLPFACMLGGPDRCTLFILTAKAYQPEEARASKSGRIEIVEVAIPGAGLP
jgi:sugar lactone lactonase YvrE